MSVILVIVDYVKATHVIFVLIIFNWQVDNVMNVFILISLFGEFAEYKIRIQQSIILKVRI